MRRLWLLLLVLLAAAGAVTAWAAARDRPAFESAVPAATKQAEPPQPRNVEGRYLFGGTIFWGRRIQKDAMRTDGTFDYNHPFSGLQSFGPEQYDTWIADLECPTSTKDVPMQQQEVQLVFNCKPEFLPEASKYFGLVNLANNHTDNLGTAGLDETRQALQRHGIQPFGHYEPGRTQDTCEVAALPVRIQKDDHTESKGELPVAFCAWHYFYRLPLPGELEVMRQYADAMPVFAFLHMGVEYRPAADTVQQRVARAVADMGSEFVVANNPHWVQNTEVHNGKLIVYSTGNFIFDQFYGEELTRSASLDVTMSAQHDADLQKWLALGEQCKKYQDDCLQRAKQQGLTKPQLRYKFGVVAGDSSSRVTKRADAALQQAIEERTNWLATLQELGQQE